MKNKSTEAKQSSGTTKVLLITREEGAYCVTEFEIPVDVLVKHSKKISRSEPDVFSILVNHLTKRAREILEI